MDYMPRQDIWLHLVSNCAHNVKRPSFLKKSTGTTAEKFNKIVKRKNKKQKNKPNKKKKNKNKKGQQIKVSFDLLPPSDTCKGRGFKNICLIIVQSDM